MKAHPSGWAAYAALVLVLSLPFYAIGLAGVRLPYIPALPLTAVMVVVPAFVAIGMTGSRSGIRALLRQLWLWPGLVWVTAAIVFMPVALLLAVLALPILPAVEWLDPASIALSVVIFFVGAICEEIGWQGYCYPRIAGSPLRAALLIGAIWALWHVLPYAEMGLSATWIGAQVLVTIAMRVVIVWLVVNAGRGLLVAVLFHVMSNAGWGAIANFDALYDPIVVAALLWHAVAVIIAVHGTGLQRK